MAIMNILLNLHIIPRYGYVGATATTVITEALGSIIFFYYIYNNLVKEKFFGLVSKLLFINAMIYLILIFFNYIESYYLILLSFIGYLIILYLSKCIDSEDIEILKTGFKNKNQT